jgi:asparagine N-glycosylation enzyme membrane subunit Stt3
VYKLKAKLIIIVAIAAILLVAAVVAVYSTPQIVSTDGIGGKYNAVVTHWTDHAELTYTDETGAHSQNYFDDNLKPGLAWINSSTPTNATIMSWWDYGHMIKAVGERNIVIRNPSGEILNSIADPSGMKERDPYYKIQDVARALTTTNQSETLEIMAKQNATYLLVHKDDLVKCVWFYRIAGLNETNYISNQTFSELGNTTMIARLLDNLDTGLTLAYQDEAVKIYKLPDA